MNHWSGLIQNSVHYKKSIHVPIFLNHSYLIIAHCTGHLKPVMAARIRNCSTTRAPTPCSQGTGRLEKCCQSTCTTYQTTHRQSPPCHKSEAVTIPSLQKSTKCCFETYYRLPQPHMPPKDGEVGLDTYKEGLLPWGRTPCIINV